MYPPEVVGALREALRNIYWHKDDLRLFLLAAEVPPDIVSKQAWHDPKEYKVIIAGKVLQEILSLGQNGLGPVRRLVQAVLDLPNFDHLRRLEDSATKIAAARNSVENLRKLVLQHDDEFRRMTEERKHAASKVD